MARYLEDWIDRYRFFIVCSVIAIIPIFFLPLTPDDPFLIPKQVAVSFFACSLGLVVLYQFKQFLQTSSKMLLVSSLIFLICISLSIPGSTNYHEGMSEFNRWIYLVILFFSAIRINWTPLRIRMIMIVGIIISGIIAISALLEFFETIPFYLYPFKTGRLYSFFGHQNIMAQYLTIMALWGTGLTLSEHNLKKRLFFLILTVLSGLAILFTFCRGAILATIISLCIFLFHFLKDIKAINMNKLLTKKVWYIVILLLFFLMAGGLLLLYMPNFQKSKTVYLLLSALNRGDSFRLTIWRDTINMLISNPLRGIGLGNYSIVYPLYKSADFNFLNLYAYNELLHIVAETGIIGFIGFILFFIVIFRISYKQLASLQFSDEKIMLLGIFYGCVATILQSMVSYDLHSSTSSAIYFISLGILCAQRAGFKKQLVNYKKFNGKIIVLLISIILSIWGIFSEAKKIIGHHYYSQALLYSKKGNGDKSIEFALRALQFQQYNPKYHYFLANKYLERGRTQIASSHFQDAQELSPFIYNLKPWYMLWKKTKEI